MNQLPPAPEDSASSGKPSTLTDALEGAAAEEVLLPPPVVTPAVGVTGDGGDRVPRLRAGIVWVLVFLTFGASMAVVTPMGFSLSVKLEVLVPGQVDVLGIITGVGAIASVIATPLVGVLSDRTRSRLGRRRPWAIGGVVVGMGGLYLLAVAPSVGWVVVGWVITLVAWQTATNMVIAFLGDRLPEEQRARVSAFNGFANMVAPIFGVGLVSAFASQLTVMFLIPGVIGVIGVILFAIFARDVPGIEVPEHTSIGQVFSRMVFNPRRAPDYAWNWLGRALLFFGLSFTTTYGTYFIAARLGQPVSAIGGIVAIVGIGGVLAGALGALGVGFLSDRLKRRKIFVVLAGVLMLVGTLISAFSYSLPGLMVGAILGTLAIGAFSTVDQAIVLDVLPNREESGRYLGIMQLAQQLPGTVGPLVAAGLLAVGAASTPNYTLLYIASGALALVGALIILFRVRSIR